MSEDESVAIPTDMETLPNVTEQVHAISGWVILEFISEGELKVFARYRPQAANNLAARLLNAASEARRE